MEKKRYHQMKICLILFLSAALSGCIKDDRSDCPTGIYRLIVQTDSRDFVEPGGIKDVYLFIFDGNNRFVDAKSVALDKVIELQYPDHSLLKVVAWANTGNGNEYISPADENLILDNATVVLLDSDTRSGNGYSKSPDDLFHGIKDLDMKKDTRNQPEVLTIKRKVAAITIIAKHLKEYAELITGSSGNNTDYSYEVRSSKNTIDFYGNLKGTDTKYMPASSFNNYNELIAPAFFVFPTEAGKYIEVDIFKGPTKVYTIDKDQNGMPIHTEEGRLTQLIVDFGANIETEITIKDWDQVNVSEEF